MQFFPLFPLPPPFRADELIPVENRLRVKSCVCSGKPAVRNRFTHNNAVRFVKRQLSTCVQLLITFFRKQLGAFTRGLLLACKRWAIVQVMACRPLNSFHNMCASACLNYYKYVLFKACFPLFVPKFRQKARVSLLFFIFVPLLGGLWGQGQSQSE